MVSEAAFFMLQMYHQNEYIPHSSVMRIKPKKNLLKYFSFMHEFH